MDIIETIKEQIANNTIPLYMKGRSNAPQCGFSSEGVPGCYAVRREVRLRGYPAKP